MLGNKLSPAQKDELAKITHARKYSVIHDSDFNCFRNCVNQAPSILDIGANRGQSIVSLKSIFPEASIVSYEANPLFWPVLESLASHYRDVKIVRHGLGSSNGTLAFYIPVVDEIEYLEEASIRRDNFELDWVKARLKSYGHNLVLKTTQVEIRRGDEVCRDYRPDIIKIDVEGAEYDVIESLEETISGTLPILLVENSDYNRVTGFLRERGYRDYQYIPDNNCLKPLTEACTNTFYVHDKSMSRFIPSMKFVDSL